MKCITNRKDEQIEELNRQTEELQATVKRLQETHQTLIAEKASLVNKMNTAQARQKEAERRAREAYVHRPSIQEETGITLNTLKLSEASVEVSLQKHGIRVVDLYTRILQLEDEYNKLAKEKEEAEL